MARTPKTLTPAELRSAKATLKTELATAGANAKAADKAIKEAQKTQAAARKAADSTFKAAEKALAVAYKEADKAFNAVNKEQGKIAGAAATATSKLQAKLTALDSVQVAPAKAETATA